MSQPQPIRIVALTFRQWSPVGHVDDCLDGLNGPHRGRYRPFDVAVGQSYQRRTEQLVSCTVGHSATQSTDYGEEGEGGRANKLGGV